MRTPDMNPVMSKAERKRAEAEAYNARYVENQSKPVDREAIIAAALKDTVKGFSKGLGL